MSELGMERTANTMNLKTLDDVQVLDYARHPLVAITHRLGKTAINKNDILFYDPSHLRSNLSLRICSFTIVPSGTTTSGQTRVFEWTTTLLRKTTLGPITVSFSMQHLPRYGYRCR